MNTVYFEVGIKKGEWDFGVSGAVYDLSYAEMKGLREMIVVGIGTLEQMWRDAHQRKNPCFQATKPDGEGKKS